MPNVGGEDKVGEPGAKVPVVTGEAPEVASPPPVAPETAGGPAGDIRPPAEAGQKVEVPVQAPAPAPAEQPDAMAQAQAEIDAAGGGPAEEVAPVDEPLKVVGADSKQTAQDAVAGSREKGKYGELEAVVSPDVIGGEQATKPTAVEVKKPPVGTPVAEEPAPASTEGVLEGLGEMPQFDGQGENAVPKRAEDQPEPQPAPEPAAPAQPLASEVPDEVPPDGGPSVTPEGSQIPEEDPEKRVDSFLDEDFSLIIKIDPTTGLADRRLFFKAQALLLLQLRVEGYRRIGLPDDRIVRDIDREVEAIEELHGNGGAK